MVVPSAFAVDRSRSQPGSRRVIPTTTATAGGATTSAIVERLLPNGDLYSGSFVGNVPHGTGKYLWADGCMYEGEWRRGKASGKGRFSWPSGATYEGEFKSGRMDGTGIFIGPDGDTYCGSWNADRRYGYGKKSYANGDYYEGMWKRDLQDGHGRYVWKNGNEYSGEWKNGVISGTGVLSCANGSRYEGQWENGVLKGSEGFAWPERTSYVGCEESFFARKRWSFDGGRRRNLVEKAFARSSVDGGRRSLVEKGFARPSVDGGRRSLVEKGFPRICIWELDGEAGDITCDIIDNVEASMFYWDGSNLDQGDDAERRRSPKCFAGEIKKPGQTISKGHKNYDLMLTLQLGIRYSVGKPASTPLRDLKPSDFDPKEKFWTRFPPEGSKITPPHQSVEFRWKDYCPMVFRHLRELFGIDPADYMLAICGNAALRELSSPGKSGSFFYLTQDDRFMIKTVKKSEVKVLIRMLPSYYQHVCRYENSLVTKFFGVHCVKPVGGQKTRFIVMGNLFCSEYRIHRRFDLKGSSHGRMTDKSDEEIDETTTFKDLDLNFVFRLQRTLFQELVRQIDQDCEFLEAERIMDYSLLVGLHFRDDHAIDEMGGLSPYIVISGKNDIYQGEKVLGECRFFGEEQQVMDRVMAGQKPLFRLGANVPARAEQLVRMSDAYQYTPSRCGNSTPLHTGETYEVILYFGIIDILQDYDICKKLEHAYKSLQADPTSISAVDPKLYSKRFREFISKVFVEDGLQR